jgi:membrane associated rhomboid family serine protease
MLPLGDDNRDRERWPVVTAILIGVNVAVFLYELTLDSRNPRELLAFVHRWAVVPLEYRLGQDLPPETGLPFFATLLTSMFLHGGWAHLGGNMLYLWIFGDNVEDRFGRVGFVLFYVATGVAGALAQVVADPGSRLPMVGASAAISGVLGAYVTMFPRKQVRVLLFFMITAVPAVVVIGLWIVMQLVNGYGSLAARTEATSGGVAYLAHIGGFAAGVAGALIWRAIGGVPVRHHIRYHYDG